MEKKVFEIEEVVIASNTLSFDEYVELRLIAFSLYVTNIGIVFDAPLRILRENDIDVFELFYRFVKNSNQAPKNIRNILDEFKKMTIEELWDSTEQIESHYQNEAEYKKLLSGEAGFNLIQYFHALTTSDYMDDWTNHTLELTSQLLKESGKLNSETEEQFLDVTNYCRGLSHNVMNPDRMKTNPEFTFRYDIKNWLDSDLPLKNFKYHTPKKITFNLTNEQFQLVEDEMNVHGIESTGKAQVLKRIPIHLLWRKPTILN